MQEAKRFVDDKMREYVSSGVSPVAKHGKFKTLGKEWGEIKGSRHPDLEWTGAMLGSTKTIVRRNEITTYVTPGKQSAKADGHCNHSGRSEIPTRRFVPDEGEIWKKSIVDGVKRIIRDA